MWNHFNLKSNTIAKCSYCSQEISYSGGSTGNLLRHIKTKHVTVNLNRQLREQRDNNIFNEENADDPIAVTPFPMLNAENPDDLPSSNYVQNQPSLLNYISSSSTLPLRTTTVSTTSSIAILSSPKTTLSNQTSISSYIIANKPISLSKSKAIDQQITRFIVNHFHLV